VEDLEHLNEDGELWFAYEGLKKATRLDIPLGFWCVCLAWFGFPETIQC
jgi:hypothetical protein